MTKNQKLMRRVNILLENKNNKFKRKYFLLSTLAKTNIKNNKHLYSEAECYANVLIETNGEKPSEDFLIKLNEQALRFSGCNNIEKEINFIKNYNDILNSKSSLFKESIIEEELTSILNNDYKLNEKLLDTLMESINKKICLLLESDDKTNANNFEELEKIIDNQAKRIESLKDKPKNINLKQLGYVGDRYVPGENEARLTALEKVGQDAISALGASIKAKRKFDIIRQIHFYLNVQQKLNLAKITMQGKADLTQSKERFSSRPSGLTDEEVGHLRSQLDNMLKRHQNYEDLNLDDDTIKEGELLGLLFKAAGDRSEDARDYLAHLNRHMPLNPQSQEREPLPYDEDFSKDMSALDQQQYKEDEEAKIAAGIDPETGQPLYEPDVDKVAQMSREQFAARDEERKSKLPSQETVRAEDALNSLNQTFGPMRKIKEILDDVSPEITKMIDNKEFTLSDLKDELENISSTIDPEVANELESLVDALESDTGINIKILPPESKTSIRSSLYDVSSTPEDFAYFVSKFIDTDKPLTLRDLGALMSRGRQGVASDANAVRQGLTKSWFRALFFSFDDSQKASVYATLADLFFKQVETLDLFKDDVIKIPGQKDLSGTKAAEYFDFVKDTMTKERNIKKFLTDEFESDSDGDSYSREDQKNDMVDEMLTGNTAFRIFATSLMKDYYNNNVWNKCESDLTYAIKEYFEKHYPTAEIAKDLPAKPSSKDSKSGKKQKMFKSRDVKKEQGKDIFNPIIYATMGRTGIKDSKGTLVNPEQMSDKRKQEFRKGKTLAKIQDFSANYKMIPSKHGTGPFDARDLEDLMDDIFSPKGIIGGTFAKFQKMDKEEFKNFIKWADSLKEKDLMQEVSQAFILSNASSVYKQDEFMDPQRIDSLGREALGRLKEYMKLYKDKIAEQRKNLSIEDAEFVSYKGQKCEVDDIEMKKKIIHIYLPDDTLIKVPFDQVSLLK